MKSLSKIWGILMIAVVLSSCSPSIISAQNNEQYISNQQFYDELSPYGTWVDDPQYGNVWVPDVDGDFRPYATNGHWVLTEYGNTWVSDYDWGWAAFHYGRWHFDDYYGWEWVPGNDWAPAWVSWRSGGGYYGWAPLSPEINYDASFTNDYYIPDNYWMFTQQAYINQPDVYNYYVPYGNVRTIIRSSTYIRNNYVYNNRRYYTGPRRDEIQRYSRNPVRLYNIRDINRPGAPRISNNNTVNIYRPWVRQNTNARPSRVVDGEAYRQQNPTQRIGGNDRRNGTLYNRDNATRLANTARDNNPDNRVVRVNYPSGTGDGAINNRPTANPRNRPSTNPLSGGAVVPTTTDGRTRRLPVATTPEQQQRREQAWQQQRQQRDQQGQPANTPQTQQALDQQDQQQTRELQRRQAREQQRQQMTDQQRQQIQQQREQQRQQSQQQRGNINNDQRLQQQQAREQQRQQQQQAREQQRQQMQQQNQQMQDQQRQQADQQRQQQQQARDQQRQQLDQQRQQQQQARDQQRQQLDQQRQQQQQARDQQRQQADQQRQQQQEQQRQQQQQARDQQRQQADQQRQQQQEQQRQARDQQRQQQDQQRQSRPGRP